MATLLAIFKKIYTNKLSRRTTLNNKPICHLPISLHMLNLFYIFNLSVNQKSVNYFALNSTKKPYLALSLYCGFLNCNLSIIPFGERS